MRFALTILFAIVFTSGCYTNKPQGPDPFELQYPKKVKWSDPVEVMKAFYGAKKRGDWKKAYEICDFKEVLSKEDARRIMDEWKKDSEEWADRSLFKEWYVIEVSKKGDTAVVSVMEVYPSGNSQQPVAQTTYEETLKLYGKRWKLTAAEKWKLIEGGFEQQK